MERKTYFFYSLFTIGFCLLTYLFVSSGIVYNLDIFQSINPVLVVLALGLSNLNVLIKVYRWKYLSRAYGRDIRFPDAGRIVLAGFFVSGITPAKIGDVIKAYIMKKKYSLPLMDGIFSILYERAFELLTVFFVSLGILYVGFSARNYFIIQLTSLLLLFLAIAYVFSERLLTWGKRFLIRTRVIGTEGEDLRIQKIAPLQALAVFTLTGLALSLEFLRIWLVVLAFGFSYNIIHLSIFFSLSSLIGALSQVPIGLGVVEGSLTLFLTDAGLPPYYAFGIVLADRALSMYYVALIGLFYYKWALTSAMEESG